MMVVFLEDLLAKLRNIPRSGRTLLVGIDGCGGSGKSTLAKQLEALGEDVTVVHMDDFPPLDLVNLWLEDAGFELIETTTGDGYYHVMAHGGH